METVISKMKVEKYSEYKYSGAEWLGDIPNNWDSIKMKHLFQDVSIKKKGDAELLSVTQDQGVVPRTWVENRMVMPSGALDSFKFINKGDFAISLRSFEGGLEYCHHDGIISPAYTVLKAKRQFETQFYKYLFKSFSFISELQTSVVGIRQGKNISFEELSYSYLPIPPLAEQTAIAAFLDRKTALIDQAIDIKQKQIELLKERKQILIHKAVTRGLNSNVKMKDSGVEWIGEIPEGWEVKKLRYLANCFPSNVDKHCKPNEKEVRLCNYTDVYKNDYITDDMELMIATASDEQIAKFTLRKGDIIITKDSETASDIAVPTFIKEELTNVVCGYHLAVIRTYLGSYSKYLFQALKTKLFNAQFEVCSNGITRVGLGNSDLRNGYFLLPPEQEQNEIAEFIVKGVSKIANAISLKEQEIEKLKEYKATLINSAVTGKLKVI
jgi:type I restriction enzyme S subunit